MITRSRMAVVLLGLTFFFSLILGPLSYAGTIVEDEDRFVAAAGTVIEHPEIRRAVADEVTQLTFASIEADETVAELLPESARTFVVPITQFAAAQVTQVAFVLLDTELAVEARDASLRELHRQVVADDDELVIDLRAMLVRTTRELAGSSVAAGVAQVVSGQDTGRFVVAEAGSEEAQILDLVRALPAIGSWAALAWLLTLGGGIAVARDRQQALLIGGLLVVAGTVVGLVIVVVLLYAVLGGLGSSSLGPAVADAIATDFVAQQRGTIVVGLVLAGAGLLLGESPAAVALRRLPRALWQRDRRAISDAIGHALGDNPAVASIVVWVTAGVTLGSWSNPTIRVTATVIVITVIARITLWLHRSGTPRADDWRQRLGIVIPSLDPDAGERGEWGPAIRARRAIEQDPRSTRLRFWRLNVAIAFGIAFLFWPRWGVSLVVGFFVVLAFVQAGLEVPEAWRVAVAERQITGVPATSAPAEPPRSRWAGAALAGGLVVAALVAVTIQGGDRAEAATGCNGHAELCDRRVDDVVFAGSHNSMSSTELGWDLAMQTGDIIAQLDHGVRALLIDTHYWSADGRLDGGPDAAADAVIEASLSTDVPQPGTWLCHGFCALGATNLEAALADITFWLAANPREVLLMVVQDEITTADTIEAFENSGLLDLVHQHEQGTPFPTLGELIELDQRVLVYAENEGSPDSWYQNAFANTFTETPFTFALRSDFSCDPNRGQPDNPLYLVNHWVTTGIPIRQAAAAINSRDALLERVEDCEATTGRRPTVLAVDFVETGDLIEVVDELNGVGSP